MTPPSAQLIPVAGALFLAAPDPMAAVAPVERLLINGSSDEAVELDGVPIRLVAEYSDLLPRNPAELRLALMCGAAWAMGIRATPRPTSRWRPVVSGAGLGPPEFRHRTGESLIQLIMSARDRLRFAPAYFDVAAARYLGPSIAAATERGVCVELLIVEQLEKGPAAEELILVVEDSGSPERLLVQSGRAADWFAHMKVLSVDTRSAYIGSANSTLQGLSTNFELGAVVEGAAVATIDAFLDRVKLVMSRAAEPEAELDPSV